MVRGHGRVAWRAVGGGTRWSGDMSGTEGHNDVRRRQGATSGRRDMVRRAASGRRTVEQGHRPRAMRGGAEGRGDVKRRRAPQAGVHDGNGHGGHEGGGAVAQYRMGAWGWVWEIYPMVILVCTNLK